MSPHFDLDENTVRRNATLWRAYAGVPLRAVVKSNGYGWGYDRIVRAVDDAVDGYFVSDADEFQEVRALTRKPIATLTDVALDEIGNVLDRGGIPSISSPDGIKVAGDWAVTHAMTARIRFGIRTAIGWSGVPPSDVESFAIELARRRISVECWTHITDPSLQVEQLETFERARNVLLRAGVTVVATDVASSVPLATGVSSGTFARLGVGLFGFRFRARVDLRSALRVRAAIVSIEPACGQRVGYGLQRAPQDGFLAVVRCGYGDGFPRMRNIGAGLLAVGMQFATYRVRERPTETELHIIDASTDLDALLTGTGLAPHELVVALGRASHDSSRGRLQDT